MFENYVTTYKSSKEINETLKMLGFKDSLIDEAVRKINLNQDIEFSIEEAIKLMPDKLKTL
ncbi:RuvA C-terminal domain-containing protein [Mycoplasmopsis fermentans]|uniref:RuvA C-terminal domain-containing protein n=1 Tax=Mycoplasmopsis fermentans TaxID=2115 RepID=UPI0001E33099|nr:RuvA C-terminal domain-containing protein [Mycoplasmopsis fermentans]ADN68889.1 hypothetical protein MFE_02820 [Mycoplasmopsis fermentans JER]